MLQLFLGIHHDGAIPGHRFLKRLARDQQESNSVFTGLNFDNSYRQATGAVMSGFDFGDSELTSPFDSVAFSVGGGYIESFLNFNNLAVSNSLTSLTYCGGTVAGSTTYMNRGFFVDALLKADFLTLDIGGIPGGFCTVGWFATCGRSVKSTTWGVVGNVG